MAFRDLLTDNLNEADLVLVGIPYDKSASVGKGTRLAPQRLRKLSEYLPPYTMAMNDIKPFKIYDAGDYYPKKTEASFDELKKACSTALKAGKFTLFLGGDHAVAIATEKAWLDDAKEKGLIPILLHMDAHADICDFYDGSKLSHATPVRRTIDNGLEPKNVLMFGIRSYEDQEVQYLSAHPELKVYSANQVNDETEIIIHDLITRFSGDKYSIHLSLDIDMFDPAYAPGTGTPEHFGVESRKGLALIEAIITNLKVTSMDLVEISPALDVNDVTSWLGLKILYEIFPLIRDKK